MSLQIQMYQLSRLLHDYHRDLYNHLEEHEIGPSLYAAPWFLTVFASQFPLEVAQSCLTPSDPMDFSPPGPSVHGTFQARVLEWVAIAFSNALK